MLFLKFNYVGKPTHRVAQRAYGKLHEYLAVLRAVVVAEYRLADGLSRPNFDATTQVITFRRVDAPGADIGFVQNVARVQVAKPHVPTPNRQRHSTTVVEIEPDVVPSLRRNGSGG